MVYLNKSGLIYIFKYFLIKILSINSQIKFLVFLGVCLPLLQCVSDFSLQQLFFLISLRYCRNVRAVKNAEEKIFRNIRNILQEWFLSRVWDTFLSFFCPQSLSVWIANFHANRELAVACSTMRESDGDIYSGLVPGYIFLFKNR